ncbi:DUF504 domain-containing protein, partial [Streptomyces nojiriensis]|uniref:DUF504 domain-containing protein n=1 Tax=Streptomyces nojiriensis TaxID=66374 RepID=UPI003659A4A1
MHTSDEIYHRVLWDPRFDPERFVMGIAERGAPPKRVLLGDFVPGGEIPWHRVVFFEVDGQVVWDRASGVGGGGGGAPAAGRRRGGGARAGAPPPGR